MVRHLFFFMSLNTRDFPGEKKWTPCVCIDRNLEHAVGCVFSIAHFFLMFVSTKLSFLITKHDY